MPGRLFDWTQGARGPQASFRAANVDGVKMGQHAANWVLDHAFLPIGG